MTRKQLSAAHKIAQSNRDFSEGERDSLSIFSGFGLKGFATIHVTLWQVALLIRWQCMRFDGLTDQTSLQEIAHFGRKRFNIID